MSSHLVLLHSGASDIAGVESVVRDVRVHAVCIQLASLVLFQITRSLGTVCVARICFFITLLGVVPGGPHQDDLGAVYKFTLGGKNSLPPAVAPAVVGMRQGGVRRVLVPPRYGWAANSENLHPEESMRVLSAESIAFLVC